MKIKKMNIKYSFSQIPFHSKKSQKKKGNKAHKQLCLSNLNIKTKKNLHSQPLMMNIQEKPSSIQNRSMSFYLPKILKKSHQLKETDHNFLIKSINKKRNIRLHSINHIRKKSYLDNEYKKLTQIIQANIKGSKKTTKNSSCVNHSKSFNKNDELVEKINRDKSLSQSKYKLLDIIINKKKKNKKNYIDSYTQTCKKSILIMKKNQSKVIDLALFIS